MKIPKNLKLNFTKKHILIFTLVFVVLGSSALLYKIFITKGANYGWLQTSWLGGASTTAVARHPGDISGWTYYYSKDSLLATSSDSLQLTLASTTASTTDTTDANFNGASSTSNVYVSNGTVYLKKPNGVSCTASSECQGGFCGSSGCSSCSGTIFGNYCLYYGVTSCTSACSSRGGSAGCFTDDSNCNGWRAVFNNNIGSCSSDTTNTSPKILNFMTNGVSYAPNCSTWDASVAGARLCACNN